MTGRFSLVVLWRQNELVPAGRRAERIAYWFSRRPELSRVLYVEPPMNRKALDAPRVRKLLPLHARRESDTFWRLTLVKPNTIAGFDGPAAEGRCRWMSIALLKRFVERHAPTPRVLWVYPPNPFSTAIVRAIPHDRLICDIVDDVLSTEPSGYPDCEDLVAASQATFTTSADLAARLQPWQRWTTYVPNGLDPFFIADPDAAPPERPRERPVIGYLGVLSARTDLTLIAAVADAFPGCDLEIVGWVDGQPPELPGLLARQNVHLRERVPFDRAASVIDGFDVCLLPHRDVPLSRSMSPLKLFQYVARGKPVVATPVAGTELVSEVIHVADIREAFLAAIDTCLRVELHDRNLRRRRILAARAHTWESRVTAMFPRVAGAAPEGRPEG